MKPTLNHKLNQYPLADLLMTFADGKPLSCDQLNFLDWHQHILSNPTLDPVLKYYLKHYRSRHTDDHSFLLPGNTLDEKSIARLKRQLAILLQTKPHVELKIKPEEFLQFRSLTVNELILYHGNQFLTGAPFYPGGIPQIIFFQWGNTFGVAKYVILAEETALKSNVLIFFEDVHQRTLDRCVQEYVLNHQQDFQEKMNITPSMQPRQEPHDIEKPLPQYQSWFQIPKLTLSRSKELKDNEA